jgi:N-acyl-D-amino-acid deacylase
MKQSRRSFVTAIGATSMALSGVPSLLARRRVHDLVIRGGTIIDGTGAVGRVGDIAIANGRIVAMAGKIVESGREEFDARGMAVSPGFIDIHSHGDGSLASDPRAESVIRQGVTTIIGGQDGSSRRNFAEWFPTLANVKPAVNVASMVGLGSIRGAVVGEDDRPATAAEIGRMVAMVETALAEGACGASSGLEYTPGAFASLAELTALCRPLTARKLCYATHMRNEDDRVLESIDESIAVARGAGCGLQISHLKMQGPRNWPKLDQAFERIESASMAGLDIAFDRYPYIAYQTGLTNLFPVWSRDGGTEQFLARFDVPATADRIRDETLAKVGMIGGWDHVQVTNVREASDTALVGKRLGSFARDLGQDPYDYTVALIKRNRGSVGMVGFAMSEENLDRIYAHPLSMVCSDGGAFAIEGPTRRGAPHPRGIGSFARLLGRYVRERKALSIEQAVHKMSGFPAARVRLADRGTLAVGKAADVVVFDAAKVIDHATFEDPFQYATGIELVAVNGAITLQQGERRGEGNGKGLKPQPSRP